MRIKFDPKIPERKVRGRMENIDIQAASKLRDLATQIALNFVGHAISSSDGSYDLLIQVIYDAMLQVDQEARGDEREACAQIADDLSGAVSIGQDIGDAIRALKSQ